MPNAWARFDDELRAGLEAGVPGPPAPLILAAWSSSDETGNRLRLREQLEWAAEQGRLDVAARFLQELEDGEWLRTGGREGRGSRWVYSNCLTRQEANRALYFDFEGRKDEPPFLMGVLGPGGTRQFVFDEGLGPLMRWSREGGHRVCGRRLEVAIHEGVLGPAEAEDRRIVAFSEHELNVIARYVSADAANRITSRFLNARKFLASWIGREHPELRRGGFPSTLADYIELLQFEWPDDDLEPAYAVAHLRKQCLTAQQSRTEAITLWDRLLRYNALDCEATRHCVLRALREPRPSPPVDGGRV